MCSSVKQYIPCEAALERLLATGFPQVEVSGSGTLIFHQHSPLHCSTHPWSVFGQGEFQVSKCCSSADDRLRADRVFVALPEGDDVSRDSALSLVTPSLKTALTLLWGAVPGCCMLTASHIRCCSHTFKHRHFIFFKLVFLFQCLQARRAPMARWDTGPEGEQP